MKGSRRLRRPYARPASAIGRMSAGSQLATAAGMATVEKLEPRQLLFSLTITPSDLVNDTTGEVRAVFGYTIPYFFSPEEIEDVEPEEGNEDFNQIEAGQFFPIPPVPYQFESGLRVSDNIAVSSRFAIRFDPNYRSGFDDENGNEILIPEEALAAQMVAGEQFTFSVRPPDAPAQVNIGVYEMSMDIYGYQTTAGLNASSMRVDLFFRGQLVASYTGAALEALRDGDRAGRGRYTFETNSAANPVFDQIRFTSNATNSFAVDNVSWQQPGGTFASIVESRIFGAEIVFSGPVGATIRILDLYGREMIQTTQLGTPDGLSVPLVDLDDNGIPNFNDGIGRIELSGTDLTTSLTIIGGTVDPEEGFQRVESVTGIYDDFEDAGFGLLVVFEDNEPTVVGMPPGPGSVIIGSPFTRSLNNYSPAGFPSSLGFSQIITDGFSNPNQGIFVNGGASMGSVSVHGMVFGSSQFSGAVDTIAIGSPLGSFTVQGDLGSFISGGDAGMWVPDPDTDFGDLDVDTIVKTSSTLFVGRTLGEFVSAGRSLMDITVVGNLAQPSVHPLLDSLRYREREVTFGILLSADEQAVIAAHVNRTRVNAIGSNTGQGYFFGDGFYRNDSILSAEFVNRQGTSVIISGKIGLADPVNTYEDPADVYAFVVDGTTDVRVEISGVTSEYVRIVDQDGRMLAANSSATRGSSFSVFSFTPPAPGAYYLVVTNPGPVDGNELTSADYEVTLSGLAPVTFGALRTVGSLGQDNFVNGLGNDVNIAVLNGSLGSIRVGTGYRTSGGDEAAPDGFVNTDVEDAQAIMFWGGGTVSVQGSLYNITTGSDLNIEFEGVRQDVINVFVGGNVGNLVTGLSTVAGGGNNDGLEGDVGNLNLTVGGRVGVIDIRGSIGVDRDAGITATTGSLFTLQTGINGGDGSIGMIRVGGHIFGPAFSIRTSPGSIVGGLLVSQDAADSPEENTNIGIWGVGGLRSFQTGLGSDVRFVDFAEIDINSANTTLPIIGGQVLELIDDGGAKVTFNVVGAPAGAILGFVTVLPVDGSQGVAIGEVSIDLSGGERLDIISDGRSGTPVSIGRVNITEAVAASSIRFSGSGEIDVWRIVQTGGAAMDRIENFTPNGDIVAIDVVGIQTVTLDTGDLGRTEVVSYGPKQIGPLLGLASGLNSTVGAPLGLEPSVIDADWAGPITRPADNAGTAAGAAFLDDVGSMFDFYLNGIVVRTGGVLDVRSNGAIGDVILQGANAELSAVTANADGITPAGRFEGIIGSIYAFNIANVAIGDGLAQRADSPMATTGIFAINEIRRVIGDQVDNAFISSAISAANNLVGEANEVGGVGVVELSRGGRIIDAFISASNLDAFWFGALYGDDLIARGELQDIILRDADIFRSEIFTGDIERLQVLGGVFDAVLLRATGDAGFITADEYRNSTLTGTALEFFPNAIIVDGNLDRLTVNGTTSSTETLLGTIKDLTVDVVGDLNVVSASDIVRLNLDVDGTITSFTTAKLRASAINAGELLAISATDDIVTSTITVSGPLLSVTAADSIINTSITVSGPRGRLDLVSAANLISGAITSSGPIGTITATAGDIRASVRTTTAFGTVALLNAARDLDITTDISAGIATMTAGRHIGSRTTPSVILVRGNLGSVTAGGTLYNDIRIGNNLTGAISLGGVSAKPASNVVGRGSIIAFGRLNSVSVGGDFGGDIISWSGGIGTIAINNGSLYKGRTVAAYDGSIDSLVITNGHLLANVHADWNITSLRVEGGADGVFGDVGVNPTLAANVSYDARRNQLPPGVVATTAIDGPRITAGHDIVSFVVTNGNLYEATIWAGRVIRSIDVNGATSNSGGTTGYGTVIAAGDLVTGVRFTRGLNNTFIGAGFLGFGADNRPGGTGLNADVVKPGVVNGVSAASAVNVDIVAGVSAGADGLYIGGDDRTAVGVSSISNVVITGLVNTVRATTDSFNGGVDARIIRASLNRRTTDPDILGPTDAQPGVVVPAAGLNITVGGVTGRVSYSGPGQIRWDAATRTITFSGTTGATSLLVTGAGSLADLRIIGRDDTSIGAITVQAPLTGASTIKVDADLGSLVLQGINTTGRILVGGTLGSLTTGDFLGGHVMANALNSARINGVFGSRSPGVIGEASISAVGIGTVTVTGNFLGLVSADRTIASIIVGGGFNTAYVRAGDSIGSVTAGAMTRTWISARDAIASVSIAGDMFDSSIMAGIDLGADGAFGGTGVNADLITTGVLGSVTIGGSFRESDVVAGVYRGRDGFFGNADDIVAEGRSRIDSLTIGVAQVGSNVNSESYAIASTGPIGSATIAGQAARTQGNLKVGPVDYDPVAIQVTSLTTSEAARVYTATLVFNIALDASTISRALSVSEVRGTGNVTIRLIEGIDYTLTYNAAARSVAVTFSRAVTERNLPQVVGVPAAGVFRFELDQSILRGSVANARLDGDGDGFIEENDHYSEDTFIGDAGDKLTPGTQTVNNNGLPAHSVDFYAPFNLDIVMDNNRTSDGVADANRAFTIRGTIGDHPDTNINFFRPGGDVDLYRVTLQAGQILRLGQMQGSALLAGRSILGPDGQIIGEGGSSAALLSLPVNGLTEFDLTGEAAYLIKQTGVYIIAIANHTLYTDPNTVPNINSIPGAVGNYIFTVEIFDDGDSGFNASTNSGDGAAVVNAPVPIDFAGADRVFGTADDVTTRIIGSYTFTLNAGPDGVRGTADDVVTGTSPDGVTSTYSNAVVDGVFMGVRTIDIASSIGPSGHRGVPGDVWADVDIFHLNNRQAIAPNTRFRVTVKLADIGADLGSRNQRSAADILSLASFFDYRGAVQFGLFDVTNATGIDDGLLVFSPTDFTGREGVPGVIAENANGSYGFDANGDFYIDFVTPGGLAGGAGAKYALYLQGAFNTDYRIQVVQYGAPSAAPERTFQNILLETRGGTVNWLEAGGLTTTLGAFDARALGYAGNISDGRTVQQFLLDSIISQLTNAFNAAGVDVRISTNPADFEFQDYSTVFLTSSYDPVNFINSSFTFFGFTDGSIFSQPFGYSERSDPLNTDARDEAVVFVPSLSLLGFNQSQAELNFISQSLTAAVGRRVGELLGLRVTDTFSTLPDADIMASNSVNTLPGLDNPYRYSQLSRPLSSLTDQIENSNFFLGRQRSISLLDRILAD